MMNDDDRWWRGGLINNLRPPYYNNTYTISTIKWSQIFVSTTASSESGPHEPPIAQHNLLSECPPRPLRPLGSTKATGGPWGPLGPPEAHWEPLRPMAALWPWFFCLISPSQSETPFASFFQRIGPVKNWFYCLWTKCMWSKIIVCISINFILAAITVKFCTARQ